MATRPAIEADLDTTVDLSRTVRENLERLEPVFWRRHPDADRNLRGWFGFLLDDASHHLVVNVDAAGTIEGFIIARAMDAPPVYDPGGRTCMVDDFVWPTSEVADQLIAAVRRWAVSEGCSQLVVVTASADVDRRELLGDVGLHPTSEWWTGPI